MRFWHCLHGRSSSGGCNKLADGARFLPKHQEPQRLHLEYLEEDEGKTISFRDVA